MNNFNGMGNTQPNFSFSNPAFAQLYDGLTSRLPSMTFSAIVLTYLVTAALNSWAMPLPLYLSIPAALVIQLGRFLCVFTPFLNPNGKANSLPESIATGATLVALAELAFSLLHLGKSNAEFWALFLFAGMVIVFGYILELQFVSEGRKAFGLVKLTRSAGAASGVLSMIQQTAALPSPTPGQDVQALEDEIKFLRDQLDQVEQTPLPGNGTAPGKRRGAKVPPSLLNGQSSNGNGNGHKP